MGNVIKFSYWFSLPPIPDELSIPFYFIYFSFSCGMKNNDKKNLSFFNNFNFTISSSLKPHFISILEAGKSLLDFCLRNLCFSQKKKKNANIRQRFFCSYRWFLKTTSFFFPQLLPAILTSYWQHLYIVKYKKIRLTNPIK